MALDTSKLVAALKEGEDAEVKAELTKLLNQPFTKEEEGEALYAISKLYTELTNDINETHLARLTAIGDEIAKITRVKSQLSDGIKLAETRQDLS